MTDVTIETGAIPANLFEGSGVTALTLGEGVSEIGESAFANTARDHRQPEKCGHHRRERVCKYRADERRAYDATAIGEGAFEGTALQTVTLNAQGRRGRKSLRKHKAYAAGHFPRTAASSSPP